MKTSYLLKKLFKGNMFDLIFFFVADDPACSQPSKTK